MRRPAVLAFLLVALAACSTVPVTPEGSRVVIAAAADPHCQVIGPVIGGDTSGSPYSPRVVENATRDARNAAAEQGADTVVLSPPEVLEDSVAISGIAYRCGPYAIDGWVPASVPLGATVRRAPDPKAAVLQQLAARSTVQVTERVVRGYRRVKVGDGPTGFVEDERIELVR